VLAASPQALRRRSVLTPRELASGRLGRSTLVRSVPPDGESARLLRPFSGVFIAATDRPSEVAGCLQAAYRAWRDASVFDRSGPRLAAHTRRAVAAELAGILERIRAPDVGERASV
jgi:hypothetical protein